MKDIILKHQTRSSLYSISWSITSLILIVLSLNTHQSYALEKAMIHPEKTALILDTPIKHDQLSPQERKFASQLLRDTELEVTLAVKGLNSAQLTFRPAADKWSVADCIKHIAAAEKNLWEMVDASLKQEANPEKRTGIKFTDEELIKAVKDRSHKSKTFSALEPDKSPYTSTDEAINSFQKNRAKLISFIGSTQEDLRSHVSILPIGTYDAYQLVLLIAAHTNRHKQQMDEVMANINFPKR